MNGTKALFMGGPYNQQERIVNGTRIDTLFIEPMSAKSLNESDTLETTMVTYRCTYQQGKKLAQNYYEYDFVAISPSASEKLRSELKREVETEIHAKYVAQLDMMRSALSVIDEAVAPYGSERY